MEKSQYLRQGVYEKLQDVQQSTWMSDMIKIIFDKKNLQGWLKMTCRDKKRVLNVTPEEIQIVFSIACSTKKFSNILTLLTTPYLSCHPDINGDDSRAIRSLCVMGNVSGLDYLRFSPELKTHIDIHGGNDIGFYLACSYGRLEMVKYLLKENIDIHKEIEYEQTAFIGACMGYKENIIDYFLENLNYQVNDKEKQQLKNMSQSHESYIKNPQGLEKLLKYIEKKEIKDNLDQYLPETKKLIKPKKI